MVKRVFLLILLMLNGSLGWAAVEVEVNLDPATGSLSNPFTLTVTVRGGSLDEQPKLERSRDFDLVSQQSGSSVTITNGQIDQQLIYTYTLRARRTGRLSSPSVVVQLESGQKRFPGEDVVVLPNEAPADRPGADVARDVVFRQSVDKQSVFAGEQVVNSLSVYTRVNLRNLEIKSANFADLWAENLGEPQQRQETVNGMRYQVQTSKVALYPLKAGMLSLPARQMSGKVPAPRTRQGSLLGDFMDFDPFNMGGLLGSFDLQSIDVRSNALELLVKEVPPLPDSFPVWGLSQPLVGETTLAVSYDSKPVKVGQDKTINLVIRSLGNLSPLKEAPLQESVALRVYQEQPQRKEIIENGKLLMQREIAITLIPLKSGVVELPPIELGFLDPLSGEYRLARSEPVRFEVTGSPEVGQPKAVLGFVTPEAAAERSGSDSPKPAPTTLPYQAETFLEHLSSRISVGLALLLVTGAGVVVGAVYFMARLFSETWGARQALRRIELSQNVPELQTALLGLIHAKLGGEPRAAVTAFGLKHRLSELSNPDLRFIIQQLADELDFALYGGQEISPAEFQKLRHQALELARKW